MLPGNLSPAPHTIQMIHPDSVVSFGAIDYYVTDSSGRGKLDLIRMTDWQGNIGYTLKPGARLPVRQATPEERKRYVDIMAAKYEQQAAFREGAIVKPNKPSKHFTPGMIFVIIKVNAKTVSIAELGGGVMLNSPIALLDIVKLEDVLK